MSQTEVQGVMGAPTESKDEPIPMVGGQQTTYTYRNDTSEVVIVFKNDKVKENTERSENNQIIPDSTDG